MARYAQVMDPPGFIVNVVEWDGDEATWTPPTGYTMVEDVNGEASPGGIYKGGIFYPPGVTPPSP